MFLKILFEIFKINNEKLFPVGIARVNIILFKYRVIQLLRAHTDGCRSRPWLACWPASGPLYSRCFQTLTVISVYFPLDGHAHGRTFANRRL